nr:predicted GPI-anchored protein 58 [Penaeus vannamei]
MYSEPVKCISCMCEDMHSHPRLFYAAGSSSGIGAEPIRAAGCPALPSHPSYPQPASQPSQLPARHPSHPSYPSPPPKPIQLSQPASQATAIPARLPSHPSYPSPPPKPSQLSQPASQAIPSQPASQAIPAIPAASQTHPSYPSPPPKPSQLSQPASQAIPAIPARAPSAQDALKVTEAVHESPVRSLRMVFGLGFIPDDFLILIKHRRIGQRIQKCQNKSGQIEPGTAGANDPAEGHSATHG